MCFTGLDCRKTLPLSRETDSFFFLVVRPCAAHIVPEKALSSCSQPFSVVRAHEAVRRLTVWQAYS
jgi:hypothetical protein